MTKSKLDALTGLRFLAAAMILIHHSPFHIPVPAIAYDHGVSFFFVLSGFILAYVHPTIGSMQEVKAFLWNRVARIWPAHLVTLMTTVFLFSVP